MVEISKLRSIGVLFALLVFALSACATAPYTERRQLMLIEPSQELALGQRASAEVLSKAKPSRDPVYVEKVEQVGRKIAGAADRPDFAWEFRVLDDPKTVNAFCLPGGKVFVYTGMFKYAETDGELATVVAHEVAHAVARHGAERMSTALLAQTGQTVAAGLLNISSPVALSAFNTAYGVAVEVGVTLPYSRTQEYEADRIGLILMAKAGYDPNAAVSFWEKMKSSKSGSATPAFLSTHPTDEARIEEIKKFIPEAMKYYRR
ncbi:M48 family metallopeptidase [Desulforhabdus sp. TSK]|uniref:M48 family metallopeptidase n=1 Tax=Desulforhabdus sp. TSK TaxID=2925014 RepID=UPI001FC8B3A2|nr:M48 family metallopeptidase [Desulforhabdus sp. TSK]GKT08121.1 lipoprotein [Desulforhabdus sp. TSK]